MIGRPRSWIGTREDRRSSLDGADVPHAPLAGRVPSNRVELQQ